MMSLTFGLFTQVSGSGPLGPLVTNASVFTLFHDEGRFRMGNLQRSSFLAHLSTKCSW